MSRQYQSKTTNPARVVRTPCCAVCKAAGKSEAIVASHWPKDAAGATICPTLLAQECRYCHKFGHTTKYCATLAQVEADRTRQEKIHRNTQCYEARVQKNFAPVPQQPQPRAVNRGQFAAAFDDDDSDDEMILTAKTTTTKTTVISKTATKRIAAEQLIVAKAEALVAHEAAFPTLGGNWAPIRAKKEAPMQTISFAAMACKPKEEAVKEKHQRDAEAEAKRLAAAGFVVIETNKSTKSQADFDDDAADQARRQDERDIQRSLYATTQQQMAQATESALRMQYNELATISHETYSAGVQQFCKASAAGRTATAHAAVAVLDNWDDTDNSAWD
jgi:hypothetical protein